jgi:hypothetical protein
MARIYHIIPAAVPAPRPGARTPSPSEEAGEEVTPATSQTVAQLVIYGPTRPTVVEGTATSGPGGSLDVVVPIPAAPPAGTTVQLIIYNPGTPTIIEGTTTAPRSDGSFDIVPKP